VNPRNAVSAFAVLACGAVLHFSHLTWGAPSWDKHFSVFSSREEIDRWTGPILELREKYWENHAQMLDPNRSEQESPRFTKRLSVSKTSSAPGRSCRGNSSWTAFAGRSSASRFPTSSTRSRPWAT
jgi:hypothetical protein